MNYLTLERKSTFDYWRKVIQEMRWRFLQR
jgi:hypothetical protein